MWGPSSGQLTLNCLSFSAESLTSQETITVGKTRTVGHAGSYLCEFDSQKRELVWDININIVNKEREREREIMNIHARAHVYVIKRNISK